MIKKIFVNTFVYGFAPHIASIANLLLLPIITKDLTELDYGVAGTITAYTGALSAFSSLGLTAVLSNSFFQYSKKFKWVWRQIYGFLSLWNVLFAIILAVTLALLMPDIVNDNKFLIITLNILPIVFFGSTNTIATLYYTLNKQATQIGLRTAFFGTLAVLLNLYFISKLKLGYMGWFWTSFIVGVLTNISYWISLNKIIKITPIFNFNVKTIIKSLKISIPLIPHHYAYYLLDGSDRLIMDRLKIGIDKIGEFNIATTFSNFAGSITSASNNAIVPYLMEMLNQKEFKKAKRLIYLWSLFIIFITFIICLWSKEIFQLLIKNDILKNAYPLAIVLIMSYNFRPVFTGAFQYMVFMEKTKSIWLVSFVAGIISVVLNIIFIPIFGFQIAIFSSFIAFYYWGVALYFHKAYRELMVEDHHPIIWSLSIVAVTILVYYLRDVNFIDKAIITFIVVSLLLSLSIYIYNNLKRNNIV